MITRIIRKLCDLFESRTEEQKLDAMLESKQWRAAERSFEHKVESARNYI